MRRSLWLWVPSMLALACVLLPAVSYAAVFQQVIPTSGLCVCVGGAPDWGCVLQTLQTVMNDLVGFATVIITLFIAWAGFAYMQSATNSEKRSQANARILNAVIGLMIVLCSWLLIDTLMKVVYNGGAGWGPWNSILVDTNDADKCIKSHTIPGITTVLGQLGQSQANANGGVPNQVGVAKGLCSDSNTSCSVAVLQGDGLSSTEAQAMSCIAVTESAGGYNKGNSGTGAVGLFQLTGQNWNNPAYHASSCSSATSRLDDTCNRQAAELMLKSNVGYQPWTGKCNNQFGCGNVGYGQYWNPNAVACVQKYDPNTTRRMS